MGRRQWLERAIEEEYFPVIAGLEDSPEGRETARELTASIREGWVERGFAGLNQQQSLMDRTRRALRERFGNNHFCLEIIDFTRDEYFQLNQQKQSKARDRQLHQMYLKDPDAIVATAIALLDSPEWAEVAAGLAVLTGRRLNEVLRTAEFTVHSERVVTFRGALKRGGEPVPLVFEIPTLTTAERIVAATERLRAITPLDANESKVAAASDRHFAELVPVPYGKENLYSHLWRSVFGCIATFWYCPKHVDDLLFKAHILGHFETLTENEISDGRLLRKRLESFSSERHYRLYEIDDALIAAHGGKRKGIKLGTDGIEPLEVFQEGLPENQPVLPPRKIRSNLRVWKDDHDSIASLLQRFPGRTQADRVSSWLAWSLDRLENADSIGLFPDGETGRPSEPVEETLSGAIGEPPLTTPASEDGETGESAGTTEPAGDNAPTGETDDPRTSEPPAGDAPGAAGENATIQSNLNTSLSSRLEAKIDRLIDVMTLFVQSQIQESARDGANPPAKATTRTNKPREAPLIGDNPEASPLTRKYKTGEADAIINRAIDAIIAHNDEPGRLHDERWAITINALKNYSTNQRAIERVVSHRKDEIDTHHRKHQLGNRHNDRHKRKYKISDVIHI